MKDHVKKNIENENTLRRIFNMPSEKEYPMCNASVCSNNRYRVTIPLYYVVSEEQLATLSSEGFRLVSICPTTPPKEAGKKWEKIQHLVLTVAYEKDDGNN